MARETVCNRLSNQCAFFRVWWGSAHRCMGASLALDDTSALRSNVLLKQSSIKNSEPHLQEATESDCRSPSLQLSSAVSHIPAPLN